MTTRVETKGLRPHASADLVPRMPDAEYEDLKRDIKDHGVKVPIEVVGNIVLDGRHRLRAARELGLATVPVREVNLKSESQESYLLKAAVLRRHLSNDQRKMLAAMYAKAHPRQYGGDTRSEQAKMKAKTIPRPMGGERKTHKMPAAQAEAAAAMNVSGKGVEKATFVLNRAPALAEKVLQGEMPITEALRKVRKREFARKAPKFPRGKYRVIYADPPWKYASDGMDQYGPAERHYPAMSIEELSAVPVANLAMDNAVLFMWVTSPMLDRSFEVMRAWGFTYKASFVWDKIKHNYGHYNSVRHEFLLIATRGSCTPDVDKLFDSVVSIERSGKHSEKPEQFRKMIETVYPKGSRIELFARKKVSGWKTFGNEVK